MSKWEMEITDMVDSCSQDIELLIQYDNGDIGVYQEINGKEHYQRISIGNESYKQAYRKLIYAINTLLMRQSEDELANPKRRG